MEYKTEIFKKWKACYLRIYELLKILDTNYKPKISDLVKSIDEYAKKIKENAIVIILKNKDKDIWIIASYLNEAENSMYITTIWINPEFQWQGLWTTLIHELIDYWKKEKIWSIELEVHDINIWAQKFYEKNNFIVKEKTNKNSKIMIYKI